MDQWDRIHKKPKLGLIKKSNVEKLNTQIEKERKSAIDVLELALAEAKAGNVLAVAISIVGPPGPGGANAIGYYSSEVNQLGSPLLASISLTYFRFCQNMWQGDMTEVRTDDLPDPDAS